MTITKYGTIIVTENEPSTILLNKYVGYQAITRWLQRNNETLLYVLNHNPLGIHIYDHETWTQNQDFLTPKEQQLLHTESVVEEGSSSPLS